MCLPILGQQILQKSWVDISRRILSTATDIQTLDYSISVDTNSRNVHCCHHDVESAMFCSEQNVERVSRTFSDKGEYRSDVMRDFFNTVELSAVMIPASCDMSGGNVGFTSSLSRNLGNEEGVVGCHIVSPPHEEPSPLQHRIRVTCLILLGATAVLSIIDAATTKYFETFFSKFTDWLSTHPVSGILAVIVLYIVATILFIPGSILTIGTGFAFHRAFSQSLILAVLFSSTAVLIGACLGSIACFLLGRFLFREFVLRMASQYPLFVAIDRGA
jgi:hypothetical protein